MPIARTKKVVLPKKRGVVDKVVQKVLSQPAPKSKKQQRWVAQRNIALRLDQGWKVVKAMVKGGKHEGGPKTNIDDLVLMEK